MGKIVRFTLFGVLALVLLLAVGLWIAGGGDGRWKHTTSIAADLETLKRLVESAPLTSSRNEDDQGAL